MKMIILLFVFILSVGATCKRGGDEIKEIQLRQELNELKAYPNVLPVVEVVAPSR